MSDFETIVYPERKPLPDKPSELIRVALADLEKVEADPRYSVHMGDWHRSFGNYCAVCLAGSVMAMSLHLNPEQTVEFHDSASGLSDADWDKLDALDDFRMGEVHAGLRTLNLDQGSLDEMIGITPYTTDPTTFKQDMNNLADLLEQHEL